MDDESEAIENSTFGSSSYGSRFVTSDDSSDDSVEVYREKIRNLQELIGNLNKKLQSEKIRSNGIDTITAILQEERERNAKLQDELEKCKQELNELKQKQSGGNLPPAKELQSETVQLSSTEYKNLQKENISLKNELRYLSVDPAKMDEIMKENDSLKAKQINLMDELNQVKQENVNLKKIMAQSPEEKQREIGKLIGQLEEAKQQGKVNDLLCCSLADQIKVLQHRLHHTDNICQQLLCELQQKMGISDPITGTNLLPNSLGQPSSFSSPLVQMKMNSSGTERMSLQDKVKLETQLKELLEVNQKWKEYHDKREMEFQQLKQQLKETEKKLRENNSQLSEKQQEQIDQLVLQYKRQIDGLETDKEKLLDENRKLRVELNTAVLKNDKLEDQLKRLLELKQTAGGKAGVSTSANEQIQMLQWQVKTFSEDFEQEKHDRERAEQQVKDLERQLSAYRTRLASMQRERQNWTYHHGNRALIQCDDAIDLDSVEMPEPSPPPLGLISRDVHQSDNGEDYDEVDMIHVPPKQDKDEMTTKFVNCPECLTEFPRSNHSELLDHMNKCLK